MTNTVTQAIAWAQAHPTIHGQDWNGWCEALVANAGGFTNSFATATLELAAASRVYTNAQLPIAKVPNGWLLHWAYVGSDGVDYGHVAIQTPKGALMASSFIETVIHPHLGFIVPAHYQAKSGHQYLGASPDHGGQYMAGVPHTLPTATAYVVKSGDTLNSIATAHHTTWQRLYALNRTVIGPNPDLIKVGERLTLP
jgi:nucleoid-associated protein YgaU